MRAPLSGVGWVDQAAAAGDVECRAGSCVIVGKMNDEGAAAQDPRSWT